jgi:membrane fusion protein (multidrug efflux system)
MNPIVLVIRRVVTTVATMMLVVALISGGVVASNKMRAGISPPLNTSKIYAYLDYIGMRAKQMKGYIAGQLESYFHKRKEEHHEAHRKIVVTGPKAMDVIITQQYVCQIHSCRHIKVCALDNGYLQEIVVQEGQAVKKDDVMFKILPVLYKAKLDAKLAEARLAELEYKNTKQLFEKKSVVSLNEVLLFEAKMQRAKADAAQAQAEMDFTSVVARFTGIVDRLHQQLGSLIKEGEILTTLSDNSLMWVYFNVPEKPYLEYMASLTQDNVDQRIELELANHEKFPQRCEKVTIEAQFNNETGNIPFRADFKNPKGLLRHGQTGTILIHRKLHDATVIPMRSTYEILDKRYVYVVDKDDVVHQREIVIQHELDDLYVIEKGVAVGDRIVLEGTRQVRDGEKEEYEFRPPEEVMQKLKNHAE